jgi:hypothetical protein
MWVVEIRYLYKEQVETKEEGFAFLNNFVARLSIVWELPSQRDQAWMGEGVDGIFELPNCLLGGRR